MDLGLRPVKEDGASAPAPTVCSNPHVLLKAFVQHFLLARFVLFCHLPDRFHPIKVGPQPSTHEQRRRRLDHWPTQ